MIKGDQNDDSQSLFRIFQRHQLKVTPQRVAIYQELCNSDTHPTADAIYQTVNAKFPNISFDTVNRTLLTFARIGIVDVVEIFGGAKRFDPNVSSHHHQHCIQCGSILDFQNQAYNDLEVPPEVQERFEVISKRVILKGICSACTNKSPEATEPNGSHNHKNKEAV